MASTARQDAPGSPDALRSAHLEGALALVCSADRAIRDRRVADARLLYARALRLIRAAGYRRSAAAAGLQIRFVLGLAGGVDGGRGEEETEGRSG